MADKEDESDVITNALELDYKMVHGELKEFNETIDKMKDWMPASNIKVSFQQGETLFSQLYMRKRYDS